MVTMTRSVAQRLLARYTGGGGRRRAALDAVTLSGEEACSTMTDDENDVDRRGVELPPEALSPEALRNLVEEFVTRDGTDYGAKERGVEEKVAQVTAQLRSGEARLVFDPSTQTTNIVVARDLPKS
jgi:uncharacterized protein YheU (UPF0270 family)